MSFLPVRIGMPINLNRIIAQLEAIVVTIQERNEANALYKIRAYNKVISIIKDAALKFKKHELSINEFTKEFQYVLTQKMIDKIIDLSKHSSSNPHKTNAQEALKAKLQEVPGIGAAKAQQLIDQGITSPMALRSIYSQLPLQTQAYLKYRPLKAIPHALITYFYKQLITIVSSVIKLNAKRHIEIVGSYRRQKSTSSDIDVLMAEIGFDIVYQAVAAAIATPSVTNHPAIRFLTVYSKGQNKASAIMGIMHSQKQYNVTVDFFSCSVKAYPFHLFYATGSKEFNIRVRSLAKNKGWTLNQDMLLDEQGREIHCVDEAEIFKKLGLAYIEPSKRV
jgi:DNA polymerase/3'-5' exonuclease PolX